MPKVSVIIPIYNVEKYIEECLKSVLNQTLKEIEIICINDETPDNSMKLVKKYAQKDKRIKILNEKNSGIGGARNKGLNVATGEYIYFLDSDDYIDKNTLNELYKLSKKEKLDILYFDGETFYENDKVKKTFKQYNNYYERTISIDKPITGQEMFFLSNETESYRANVGLQFYKRTFLLRHQLEFTPNIVHEDEEFSIKASLYAKRTFHIPKKFYQRRVRENSTMTNQNIIKSSYGYYHATKALIPYITKLSINNNIYSSYKIHLNKLRNKAVNLIKTLPLEEIYSIKLDCSEEDYLYYKYMIRDFAEQKKEIINLTKQINNLKKQLIPKKNIISNLKKLRKQLIRKTKILLKITLPNILKKYSKKPQVSIIIPVYNVINYLDETLNSLLNQTMKNIEIICIDDGSNDGSYELLKKYEKNNKNIKVYKQNHEGAAPARNLGIEKSQGEYLLILDSDDIFDKTLCEKTYNRARLFNADIVLFKAKKYNTITKKILKYDEVLNDENLPKEKSFSSKDVSDKLFQITAANPWSKIWKRSFIINNKLHFQNLKSANDVFFTLTALTKADRIAILNENLVTYRVGEPTSTQSQKHKAPLEFYKAFKAVKEYLEEQNIYSLYENTFKKAVINAIYFNYNSTKTEEAKEIIREKIKNEGLNYFDIKKLNVNNFSSPNRYAKWQEIFGEES